MVAPYYLGLPMWSNRDWIGSLFPTGANSDSYLRHYSSVFNTVEGNTTFYALPPQRSVASWVEQAAADFRFSFKFPKTVSHAASLKPSAKSAAELTLFFNRLQPLSENCGPFMLQLPAHFSPDQLPQLELFLAALPVDFCYAVEVRHSEFFAKGDAERRLNALLMGKNIDRVCFDSRPLFSKQAVTEAEIDGQRKKPKLPVHAIATGPNPIVRFIGTDDADYNQRFIRPWLAKIPQWVEEGRRPYFFVHTPSNITAAEHARLLHGRLSLLPDWQPLAEPAIEDGPQLGMFE